MSKTNFNALPDRLRFTLLAILMLIVTAASPCLAATDAYVVFSSDSRELKSTISALLKKSLKVKTYNVDILALSDYSGKQKVIAKFSRATVVVILGDKPLDELKGAKFSSHLIVTSASGDDLASDKLKVYLVAKGTDISSIGSRDSVVNVASTSDLGVEPKTGSVFMLAPALPTEQAIDSLTKLLLGR